MPERLLTGSVLDEQLAMETHAVREGVLRYRELARYAIDRGDGASLKPGERMLLHWLKPMMAAIREEKRAIRRDETDVGRKVCGPVFLLLDADRMAVIATHEVLGACLAEPDGVPVTRLAYAIGRAIIAEVHYDELEAEGRKQLRRVSKRTGVTPVRVNWWAKKHLDNPVWERRLCIHVGTRLIWLLVGVASAADYDQPFALAFHHDRRWKGQRSTGYIRMDDRVFDAIGEGHRLRQHLRPRHLPMVMQPMPWGTKWDGDELRDGGYFKVRSPLISKQTPTQRQALQDADLSQVHACLNAINAVPWRINAYVLEVARQLWQSGGAVAGLPPRHDQPKPPKPADIETNEESLAAWKLEAKAIYEHNAKLPARRTELLGKLNIAEELVERPAIWLPHQLDFRGRCYPIPGHLNHQGDDLSRGLLEFAEAKEPTERGRWWLKVHLANCCGVDKVSYDVRVGWVDDQLDTFAGWVADPLVNTGWIEQDKPFQALAAARALVDGHAASHLPVQLDGTCNGLQHYAALGRDPDGAAAVNMMPADGPADIYSHVAALVGDLVAHDADQGIDIARDVLQHIDRKLVKQNVMTSVYGVTMIGARQQIYDALEALGYDERERYQSSIYLSRVTMQALEKATPGASQLMAWLRRCASVVANQAGQPVSWITPLGLPVIQPYRNWRQVTIKTVLQWVRARVDDESVPVRAGKQADGFAPNYVHSLDASHMLMTARACHAQGIAFAAVHDSYWTHAAQTDTMARTLREQFVQLHSQPLLVDLRKQFLNQHDIELPEPPPTGDYDLNAVLDATYFFS